MTPVASGASTIGRLRLRNGGSLHSEIETTLEPNTPLVVLFNRTIRNEGYLWTPLADLSGRYVAYAKLDASGEIEHFYLKVERYPMNELQMVENIRRTAAILRHRNNYYETMWMHSAEDGTPNRENESYDVDRSHPGKHMKCMLDLIEAALPLFGLQPLPPLDDRATPYAEYKITPTPILVAPRAPVIDLDMLHEMNQLAAAARFEKSKKHIRYRLNKVETEHPESVSAGHDFWLAASMLETLVSLLGGPAPYAAYNEMPPYRRYADYEELAKRVYAQSRPAVSAVQPPQPQATSPQAATAELYSQTSSVHSQIIGTGIDWQEVVMPMLQPLVEEVGKLLISALKSWLESKAKVS